MQKYAQLEGSLSELRELIDVAEEDEDFLDAVDDEAAIVGKLVDKLEFQRMFQNKADSSNAFLEVKSGAGGTESQDWAEMLFRMYIKWGEKRGFEATVLDYSPGDVAGIRNGMIRFSGVLAFGWLRSEAGIHRLVRNSPFNSEGKRHTSFASVYISPEIEDEVEIDLNMSEVRIDTYRASGAGGQHVNKTDSAVRLTHLPTGIAVQCQNERSQHKNKDWAIKLLRSRLFEAEEEKRKKEREKLEDAKPDIGWGSQIRSYVLDQSRVKDHRTGS